MRVIRAAHPDDWLAAARIHVRGWQATYRGVMSDEFLDGLVPEEWSGWRERLYRNPRPWARNLIETVDGVVVGYADLGRSRSEDPSVSGELYAIYLEPDRIGQGLGRPLIASARRALVQLGHQRGDLWVLASNHRTRAFYQADGWIADGSEKTDDLGGGDVAEVRYVRDLGSPDTI